MSIAELKIKVIEKLPTLDNEEILQLHKLSIEKYGGSFGLRHLGLLLMEIKEREL